jgi:hypothetical protein
MLSRSSTLVRWRHGWDQAADGRQRGKCHDDTDALACQQIWQNAEPYQK